MDTIARGGGLCALLPQHRKGFFLFFGKSLTVMELNDLQFKILDSLYFVEPFDNILEEAGAPEAYVADELKTLIDKGLVQPMEYDEKASDYVKSIFYDSDNMRAYHYLATTKGLMVHNGR